LQTTPPKCVDCRQYLDDPDLKFFQGDPDDAVRDRPLRAEPAALAGPLVNGLLSPSFSWRSRRCWRTSACPSSTLTKTASRATRTCRSTKSPLSG